MLKFVREMLETIDYKERILGIFWRILDKLRISPGVEHNLKIFLREVQKLIKPSRNDHHFRRSEKCRMRKTASN